VSPNQQSCDLNIPETFLTKTARRREAPRAWDTTICPQLGHGLPMATKASNRQLAIFIYTYNDTNDADMEKRYIE
jgi:hypothetical protein